MRHSRPYQRLRVLVRVVDFNGVTLEALRAELLWSVKMRGLKQIERYALVGGPDWMDRLCSGQRPCSRSRPGTLIGRRSS
jgi:hypothetical protein